MAYLTESRLREAYRRSSQSIESMHKSFSAGRKPDATVFLSHSHLDRDLIIGFIQEMKEIGLYVYVDWNDGSMPDHTNRETADKIKKRIIKTDLFMVFATENAMKSRWVPWEIGVADQAKPEKIFVIPVSKDGYGFSGNEYLQLYKRVEIAEGGSLAAFKPGLQRGRLLESVIGG